MPVAAPDFLGASDDAANLGRDITGVLMSDLDRSGLFQVIDQRAYIEKPESVNVRPRFADWRIINAQVLIIGEVEELPDGRIQVATRVWGRLRRRTAWRRGVQDACRQLAARGA